jgi:rhodanese-related sulfurtransferase
MSVSTIDLDRVRELLADGAQLVEVLPGEEFEELHLPGAINIPLKHLTTESARQQLEPGRDVIVYCWDALCDMSPRAASRLATAGFTRVHDYAASKVDWLANGLPVEGTHADRPTAGSLAVRDVVTCSLHDKAGDVLARVLASSYGFALVTCPSGVLLGRIRRSALEAATAADPIDPMIEPGPSTIRPHLSMHELRPRLERSNVRTLIVTTPAGVLLGVVHREDIVAP